MTQEERGRVERLEKLAVERVREKCSTDPVVIGFIEDDKALFGDEYEVEFKELLKCNNRKEMQEKHYELVRDVKETAKTPYRMAFHGLCSLIITEMIRIDAVEQFKKENSI